MDHLHNLEGIYIARGVVPLPSKGTHSARNRVDSTRGQIFSPIQLAVVLTLPAVYSARTIVSLQRTRRRAFAFRLLSTPGTKTRVGTKGTCEKTKKKSVSRLTREVTTHWQVAPRWVFYGD